MASLIHLVYPVIALTWCPFTLSTTPERYSHKLEGVFLLEEVPLLLTPFHEVDGINHNVALFQIREFQEGLIQEVVQDVAYQMLPTRVGVRSWVLRHPVSIGVSLKYSWLLFLTGCSSPGGFVPRPMLTLIGAGGLLTNLRQVLVLAWSVRIPLPLPLMATSLRRPLSGHLTVHFGRLYLLLIGSLRLSLLGLVGGVSLPQRCRLLGCWRLQVFVPIWRCWPPEVQVSASEERRPLEGWAP